MSIISYLHQLKKNYRDYRTRLLLNRYGIEAIGLFAGMARTEGWEYSLGYGTLLGAVREKDFIKNDDDVDILVRRDCMTAEMIYKVLKAGFKLKGLYVSNDFDLVHCAFLYHGLTFDLYGYNVNYKGGDSIIFSPFPIPGHSWQESIDKNLFQICRVHFNYNGVKDISFKGIVCSVLSNAEEFLANTYGETWRTPIKDNKGVSLPNKEFVPLEDQYAIKVNVDVLTNARIG